MSLNVGFDPIAAYHRFCVLQVPVLEMGKVQVEVQDYRKRGAGLEWAGFEREFTEEMSED